MKSDPGVPLGSEEADLNSRHTDVGSGRHEPGEDFGRVGPLMCLRQLLPDSRGLTNHFPAKKSGVFVAAQRLSLCAFACCGPFVGECGSGSVGTAGSCLMLRTYAEQVSLGEAILARARRSPLHWASAVPVPSQDVRLLARRRSVCRIEVAAQKRSAGPASGASLLRGTPEQGRCDDGQRRAAAGPGW